jgi:hypothetical protein
VYQSYKTLRRLLHPLIHTVLKSLLVSELSFSSSNGVPKLVVGTQLNKKCPATVPYHHAHKTPCLGLGLSELNPFHIPQSLSLA